MEKKSPEYAEPPPPLASFDQPPPYNPYQQGPNTQAPYPVQQGGQNQAFSGGPATVTQPAPLPVIIVQQPQHETNHVPELFETNSKDWFIFCALGYFMGWCTACYLGMKYKLKCNWFLWIFPGILFIAGAVVYGVMVATGLSSSMGWCEPECRQVWNGRYYETQCEERCYGDYGNNYEYILIGAAVFGALAFIASMILLGAMICLRRKFIAKSGKKENCLLSCLLVNICQPCAFGQMGSYASIQHL